MIAGVDGCRHGWVVALADAWPPLQCRLRVCRDFGEVLDITAPCALVVADVPIGLPDVAGPRECDREARRKLGRAASRVFNPLPRVVLECGDATECHRRHRQLFGKGVSQQSVGLRAKLLDVDRHMTPELQERIREFHPELVWQRLNAGRPLQNKHSPEGLEERKRLLRPALANLDALLAARPRGCDADDVLDALVGLELAQRIVQKPPRAQRLPTCPPRDARGLRMEIWF